MAELHAELAFPLCGGAELRREAEHGIWDVVSKSAYRKARRVLDELGGRLRCELAGLAQNSLKLQSAVNVKSSAPISLSFITAFRLFNKPTIFP